ncbi:50S ribosomal protein L15 [Patescibacteria group bacterium]|nr:50S ribosomal protein L15 [Patescibacteria group bacterium]MBU1705872.1 50S ribosomal protein L15 [Patescibacteria group bacterium]
MSLTLHTIKPKAGSKKSRKRIGRGLGSTGSYSGRGVKGQRARSGGRSGLQLKGLRKIMLSIPKERGFKSQKPKPETVSLAVLNKVFKEGSKITPKHLLDKELIPTMAHGVKILGKGPISIKVVIEGCQMSQPARALIEKAGGTIIEEPATKTKTAKSQAKK